MLFLAMYTKIEVKHKIFMLRCKYFYYPRILPLYHHFLKRKYERLYFKSIV